jgi:polygalacturonase
MPLTALRSALLLCFVAVAAFARAADFDVRSYGATGNGQTLDTDAINKTIEAASAAGGGTVRFPAGTYLSFSIRLKSNITLQLDLGCTLLAATPADGFGHYDPPEENEANAYQDFGHSHWANSLISGIGLENISIIGSGRIDGKGLVRFGPGAPSERPPASTPRPSPSSASASSVTASPSPSPAVPPSGNGGRGLNMNVQGNKAVGLKLCRNVLLRDFSILNGGHFAILATGVDNFTLDNLKVDTNRDGFDIDACRNVRVANCSVNAPHDDAICLKSSYALGFARACENITITNCQVTGYDVGSFLDGTFKRTLERAPDRDGPTGRIKAGTESNGGFKNITISNCVFDRSRGFALETVDGGIIEDITVTNLALRDVSSSPLFLRLGNRARGPEGTVPGVIRRITISNVVASNIDPRYPAIIAGIPDHPIEDLRLSNVRFLYKGGITAQNVAEQPSTLINTFFQRAAGASGPAPTPAPTNPRDPFAVPERENGYPEASMFGLLPAYGLFVRHAKNVTIDDLEIGFAKDDGRAAIVLMDVAGITFDGVKAQRAADVPRFALRNVTDFTARNVAGLPDTQRAIAANENL